LKDCVSSGQVKVQDLSCVNKWKGKVRKHSSPASPSAPRLTNTIVISAVFGRCADTIDGPERRRNSQKVFRERRYRAKNPAFRIVIEGTDACPALLQPHQNR
jgi:hypothetical protein